LTPLILHLLLKISLQISAENCSHMMTRTTGRTSTDYWIRPTVRLYVVVIVKMSWKLRLSAKTMHVHWHRARLGYVTKLILNVFVLQINTCLSKVVRKFSSITFHNKMMNNNNWLLNIRPKPKTSLHNPGLFWSYTYA